MAVIGLLVLPWWRNHSMLRDFYDYGLVMAASLRISLGEHPYVDFLTPIQTLQFLLARLAESVFGARYLSLTYANAVLIAGAFTGLTAILVRPLGRSLAILVAAAVVIASAGQHTIVWHNALGVTWVAATIWLSARLRSEDGCGAWRRLILVWAFLWVGGMTKLTYQVTALSFVSLFALAHGWLRLRPWSWVGLRLVSYAFFGLLAPFATELLYTGATPGQWWHNVIEMPEARAGLLTALGTPEFYFHTPHDYYRPLYFPFVGAWGTFLLAILGLLAFRQMKDSPSGFRGRLFAGIALAGAWSCGCVLLATNYDISYMAGAAWLVLATGVAMAALAGPDGRLVAPARIVLGAAAATLLAPAWQAAWNGTRALWGPAPLVRTDLVSTEGLPARYHYFRGMMLPRLLRQSMQAFDERLADLAKQGVPPDSFYFVNASEWMVRAVPEARHRGLPLWLHHGTTYGEAEARLINHRLGSGNEIRAVVSMDGWGYWFEQTDWYLDKRFTKEILGPLYEIRLLRSERLWNWTDPVVFALETDSTAYAKDLVATGGALKICLRPDGSFVGSESPAIVTVRQPLTRLRGEWVVRRFAPGKALAKISWRAVTATPGGSREVLREWNVDLSRDKREQALAFDLPVAGKQVALEIDVPAGGDLEAGFRKLATRYVPDVAATTPPKLDDALPSKPATPAWGDVLFATDELKSVPVTGSAPVIGADRMPAGPELMVHTPGEVWFPVGPRFHKLAGEFGLRPVAWTHPTALAGLAARVVFYQPGRLRVLFAKEIRPLTVGQDRSAQSFEVTLPGETGWVGLVFSSLNPPMNAYGQSFWRKIRAW
ncbi:MAG TPA: hypothetical protein VGM73_01530 [Candidatus Didemnitutus sp.]